MCVCALLLLFRICWVCSPPVHTLFCAHSFEIGIFSVELCEEFTHKTHTALYTQSAKTVDRSYIACSHTDTLCALCYDRIVNNERILLAWFQSAMCNVRVNIAQTVLAHSIAFIFSCSSIFVERLPFFCYWIFFSYRVFLVQSKRSDRF